MAYVSGYGNVRTREAIVNSDEDYTAWVDFDSRQHQSYFTGSVVDDSTTLDVTWVIQARRIKADGTTGVAVNLYASSANSAGGVQTIPLAGRWQVRVGVNAYAAGTGIAAIDW